jgi:hypothetical protein
MNKQWELYIEGEAGNSSADETETGGVKKAIGGG